MLYDVFYIFYFSSYHSLEISDIVIIPTENGKHIFAHGCITKRISFSNLQWKHHKGLIIFIFQLSKLRLRDVT